MLGMQTEVNQKGHFVISYLLGRIGSQALQHLDEVGTLPRLQVFCGLCKSFASIS